ncbi:hypothetical protein GCM10009547_47330 [Sporichthya brevicatena]|uniref:Golgi phosphoprotein 3 (GPP34) n=1 Tax=Sporichthya brevicatena TaxID=171442 RepID=A0ABP3SIJ3_9ACTN
MPRLSLAESALALLLDGRDGHPVVSRPDQECAAAGGALLSLVLDRRIRFVSCGSSIDQSLVVVGNKITGNTVTEAALELLRDRQLTARQAVTALAPRTARGALDRLAQHGVFRQERSRVLGVLPRRTYQCDEPTVPAELRSRVLDVTRSSEPLDEEMVALVALLGALDCLEAVVDAWDRVDEARAAEIASGYWRPRGLHREVTAVTAAVTAASAAASALAFARTQGW